MARFAKRFASNYRFPVPSTALVGCCSDGSWLVGSVIVASVPAAYATGQVKFGCGLPVHILHGQIPIFFSLPAGAPRASILCFIQGKLCQAPFWATGHGREGRGLSRLVRLRQTRSAAAMIRGAAKWIPLSPTGWY